MSRSIAVVFIILLMLGLNYLSRPSVPHAQDDSTTAESAETNSAAAIPERAETNSAAVIPKQAPAPRRKLPPVPRIALHPLSYAQYGEQRGNAAEMATLISSTLLSEMAKSDDFELLDRSLVPALFDEKSLILAKPGDNGLSKLPLSHLTLIGSLFSSDGQDSYSLKLVEHAIITRIHPE